VRAGDVDFASIERAGFHELERTGFRPDYFSIRKADDLTPATPETRKLVILTAARIGKARLIDNIQVTRG
jgi:pantoate--beta-alanine ligase